MKIAIALAVLLLLIPCTTLADGWLDLFPDEDRYPVCLYPTGLNAPVDVYLFARPPADGLRATECKIVMPDPCGNLVLEEYHPDVDLIWGDWDTGMSVSFAVCQTDPWVLVCHFQWVTISCPWSPDCQMIALGPRDDSGFFGFATCAAGYPPADAAHEMDVFLNCDPCPYWRAPYMLWSETLSTTEIEAVYNIGVTEESAADINNYRAYERYNPSDTLLITHVSLLADKTTVHVTFAEPMIEGIEYWLQATDICGMSGRCRDETGTQFGILPDLTIPWAQKRPDDDILRDCEPIIVSYEIRNDGWIQADSFDTQIYIVRYVMPVDPEISDTHLVDQLSYPGLQPGGSLIDSVAIVKLPSGYHRWVEINVFANAAGRIAEAREDNNYHSLDWIGDYTPRILSIKDAPDDQGGFVDIRFTKCPHEETLENPIHLYEVFRWNDAIGIGWEVVTLVPATNPSSSKYSVTVPTLADSSDAGIPWKFYHVRAIEPDSETGDTIYYYSCPDSGYSVDSGAIATLLQQYAASLREDAIEVSWQLTEEGTELECLIYRQEVEDEYESLPSSHIERDGLRFTYCDRDIEPGERYWYRVFYQDDGKEYLLFETEVISIPVLPLTLFQNYPNPFNPSTSIKFYLPEDSHVTLDIYDVSGMRVTSLIHGKQSKGFRTVVWDGLNDNGENVSSGIYFYRLRVGKEVLSRKMILLR